jgi:hypothetical protein
MISVQLARRLKYQGFPQELRVGSKVAHEPFADPQSRNPSDLIKIPVLDELITACGDGFNGIVKSDLGFIASFKRDQELITASADCPEVAVALLWLKTTNKIDISPSSKLLIRKVLDEVRLSNMDLPDEDLSIVLADKNIFKGYNMAVQKQDTLIKETLAKYI